MRLHVRYRDTAKGVDIVTVSASARHLWEQEHGPLVEAAASWRTDWANILAHTTLHRDGRTELELLPWLDTVEAISQEIAEDRLLTLGEILGVVPAGEFEVVPKVPAGPTGPRDGAPSPDAS